MVDLPKKCTNVRSNFNNSINNTTDKVIVVTKGRYSKWSNALDIIIRYIDDQLEN